MTAAAAPVFSCIQTRAELASERAAAAAFASIQTRAELDS